MPSRPAGQPTPPRVGLIVRGLSDGRWVDDNGTDWADFVSGPQFGEAVGPPVGMFWTTIRGGRHLQQQPELLLRRGAKAVSGHRSGGASEQRRPRGHWH